MANVRSRSMAAVASALALLAPAPTMAAVDIDGDGIHDAILREEPDLPAANTGSACDSYRKNGVLTARLNVRPPRVRIQRGFSRQRVSWRASFWDTRTGKVVATSPWESVDLVAGQFTDFGGNDDPGVNILFARYWQGSHWYEHPVDDDARVRANVQVSWSQVGGTRKYATMTVTWVQPTRGRTLGHISVGFLPRLRNAFC